MSLFLLDCGLAVILGVIWALLTKKWGIRDTILVGPLWEASGVGVRGFVSLELLLKGTSWLRYDLITLVIAILAYIITLLICRGDWRRKARKWATERLQALLRKVREKTAQIPPRPAPAPA